MKKILFLDVDGVLNNAKTPLDTEGHAIDAYMAFLVGRIHLNTGCQVVLSSAWRHSPKDVEFLQKRLNIKFYGITPSLPNKPRGEEIDAWLYEHPEVERYAIIDDENDMLVSQMKNFFKTNYHEGLTTEICERIISHFNNRRGII